MRNCFWVAALSALAIVISELCSIGGAVASDPQSCAVIQDSLRRLDCFDRMFPVDRETAKSDRVKISKWTVEESRSPIDDSIVVTAMLAPIAVQYSGNGEGEAYLVMRCAENTTSVLVATNMYMIDDVVEVVTRIDENDAQTDHWSRTTNRTAVGLGFGAKAVPFLRQLSDAKKLTIRIQDRNRITAEYDLGDISQQIEKIRSACNW